MPKYFFNVYDGSDIQDENGTELKGPKEVRFYMLTLATEMLLSSELEKATWEMEVLDEGGRIVAAMQFGAEK